MLLTIAELFLWSIIQIKSNSLAKLPVLLFIF